MSTDPVYVTSDVHLGATAPERTRAFHSWLEWAAPRGSALVINGDLFDFWFEYGSVVPRGHTRTLGLLAGIVDAGVPVHLVGGNHDWWGGSYLTDEIGVHFHSEPVELVLAGHRCLVAHGDGLGPGDMGYRMMRTVLRSGLTRWAFRWLHPDVGAAVAQRVSRTRARETHGAGGNPGRAEALERWARERLLEEDDLDAVLLGHTHRPARVEITPGRFYVNSGDWLDHDSFVVLPRGSNPYLARWEGGREVRGGVEEGRIGRRA
jgi:UDP-2,3-diacylglucosamine hydrolase